MSLVFPGVEDVFANFLILQIELIKLDLPTLERPKKAISGICVGGHSFKLGELIMNFAFFICILHHLSFL